MEESLECSQDVDLGSGRTQQKKQKPTEAAAAAEASLRCPRCDSTNTKFCYYNNYSKLQPRHYCRACRRHWTAGGTLRSVPVGGNRKNKRLKAKRTASADKGDDLTTAESSSLLPESWNQLPESWNQVSPAPGLEDCYGDGELTTESWMLRAETESWGFYQEDGLPFSAFSSSPCSRSLYDHGDEGLFAMEGSAAQLPAGSLSHWDDILDLVNLELKTPSSDRVDRTLTY